MPTAKDLREGDRFTWKPGQRKQREVKSLTVLEAGTFRGPAEFTGHIIIMMPYCKQLTLPPGHPVVIHNRVC